MYADNLSLFFSFLSLRLCLCLRRPGLHVRRTCKPGRRKHKHKGKHKALMLTSHRFSRRFLVLLLASYV